MAGMTTAERRFLVALAICPGALLGCLLVSVLIVRVHVLTDFHGRPAISPLYAFWIPAISLRILRPILAAAIYSLWIWVTSHTGCRRRRRRYGLCWDTRCG